MKPLLSGLLPLCASFTVACGIPLPKASVDVLAHADTFEVYRLEPHTEAPPEQTFLGNKIVARATVRDPKARDRIWNVVDQGVRSGGTRAKCFNPHHGIHAIRGTEIVDLVICYECGEVDVNGPNGVTIVSTADVGAKLDAELRAVGLEPLVHP